MHVGFAHPTLLLAVPVLAVVVLFLEMRVPARPRRRFFRIAVRTLLLALLVASAAGPRTLGWRPLGRRLVVVVDRSEAMGALAREEALAEVQRAVRDAQTEGARITLLGFGLEAAAPYALEGVWPGGIEGSPWPLAPAASRATLVPEPEPSPTARPAAGLAAAALAFRPGETGGVLLLTTGRGESRGMEAQAEALQEAGIRLRAAAVPREVPAPPPRIEVTAMDLPETVRGPFSLRVAVSGPRPLSVELLVDGEVVATAEAPADEAGAGDLVFEDLEAAPGLHEVAVVVRSRGGDAGDVPGMDRRLLTVEPPPRTLALVAEPEASPTIRALRAQAFLVQAAPPEALLAVLGAESAPPEALVLDVATARRLPEAAQRALVARVRNGLGLFLEPGSDEEAWTALAKSPLAEILPVTPLEPPPEPPAPPPAPPPTLPDAPSVEPPKPTNDPGLSADRRPEEAFPISLLLVLDRSGSMQGGKLAMAIEGARRAAATLSRFDRIGVITFAEEASLDVPPTPVRRLGNLSLRLAMIQSGGNTDIYAALVRAAAVMEKEDAPIRHVILLTDGQQTARQALFGLLAKRLASAGITLTAVGLGYNHDEVLLKRLVQFSPRGRYIPVDSAGQLPTILTRDTQRVAEYREREARARLPDPNRERPEEPPPTEEPPRPPQPPPPGETPPEGPDAPPDPRHERHPLHLLRPHEATRGIDEGTLPSVEPPRAAALRPGSALLVGRGEAGDAVLVARRFGLGRVMAFLLPPDAGGLAAWPDLGRMLVQGVRAVRSPRGAFDAAPGGRILHGPEGERLLLDPSSDPDAEPVGVVWTSEGETRDLGAFLPGQALPLPRLPPGAPAFVRLVRTGAGPRPVAGPVLTYLAADPADAGPRPGDAKALAAALGAGASEAGAALLPQPGREPVPAPLWPWPLGLALLLLPVDAALHRRTTAGTS